MEQKPQITSFTQLQAWQRAHKLRIEILQEIKTFPQEYTYGLAAQMQRAAISIGSNIAEGFGRSSIKERIRFYQIAKASLVEIQDQLLVARDIDILDNKAFGRLADQSIEVHKVIHGLIRSNKKFIHPNSEKREAKSE